MDFDAGLLLFLFIFFVLPLIQRVLGGATKQAPPGNQPGQRRPGIPQGQTEGRPRLPDPARTGTPDGPAGDEPVRVKTERAADLVPDDLWEILTGERRSRGPTPHQPVPVPETGARTEPAVDARADWENAAETWQPERTAAQVPEPDEDQRYQQSRPLEPAWQREPEQVARTASTTPAPARVIGGSVSPAAARPSPYATADAITPASSRAPSYKAETRRRAPSLLSNRSDLKRAFVWREVLGPPKGLE